MNVDEARFGRMFNSGAHKYNKLHRTWNAEWRSFMKLNPAASKQQIIRHLAKMRKMSTFKPLYLSSSRAVMNYKQWGAILARRGRMLRSMRAARMTNALRGLRLSKAAKFTIISIVASEAMMQIAEAKGEKMYEEAEDQIDKFLDTYISRPMVAHQIDDKRWVLGAPRGFSSTFNRNRINGVGIESAEWIVLESTERPVVYSINVFSDFETPVARAARDTAQLMNDQFDDGAVHYYSPETLPEDVRNAIIKSSE